MKSIFFRTQNRYDNHNSKKGAISQILQSFLEWIDEESLIDVWHIRKKVTCLLSNHTNLSIQSLQTLRTELHIIRFFNTLEILDKISIDICRSLPTQVCHKCARNIDYVYSALLEPPECCLCTDKQEHKHPTGGHVIWR